MNKQNSYEPYYGLVRPAPGGNGWEWRVCRKDLDFGLAVTQESGVAGDRADATRHIRYAIEALETPWERVDPVPQAVSR